MAKQEQYCYDCNLSRECDAMYLAITPPCAALVEAQNTAHNTGSQKLLDELRAIVQKATFDKVQQEWRCYAIIEQLQAGA